MKRLNRPFHGFNVAAAYFYHGYVDPYSPSRIRPYAEEGQSSVRRNEAPAEERRSEREAGENTGDVSRTGRSRPRDEYRGRYVDIYV